jgi:hypothetical protein
MARKKAYTDALNNITSFDEKRRINSATRPNFSPKQVVNNSAVYDANRKKILNQSSISQSNLKSQIDLFNEKFYGKNGLANSIRFKTQGGKTTFVPPITDFIFNITWNLSKSSTASSSDNSIVPITAFPLEGNIIGNTRDRPRINTFRTDGEFLTFLSAGEGYQIESGGVAGSMQNTPWGDRSSGTETFVIPPSTNHLGLTSLSAGIDIFTVDWFPEPVTTPNISQWTESTTGNATEKKYQFLVKNPGNYNIDINIFKPNGYNLTIS